MRSYASAPSGSAARPIVEPAAGLVVVSAIASQIAASNAVHVS